VTTSSTATTPTGTQTTKNPSGYFMPESQGATPRASAPGATGTLAVPRRTLVANET
jgi:hypothetical protein